MVNLDHIHPDVKHKVDLVLAAMLALGFPMKIVQAVRTTAEQQALFAQGRTTPGMIVTKADGVKNKSNHQIHDDGYGHAIDCAFVGADPFGEHLPWAAYGACAKAVGLKWGGDWPTPDRPHVEI